MGFAGETPWHGLGNKYDVYEPIEAWKMKAGMPGPQRIGRAICHSAEHANTTEAFREHKVLF
jgi:hypothetical protein